MRPFQEFRLWAKRAPMSERVMAGIATAVAGVLLAVLAVPGRDDSTSELTSGGRGNTSSRAARAGAATAPDGSPLTEEGDAALAASDEPAATGPASDGTTANGVVTEGDGGAAATVAGGPGCVSGSAKGVTAKEVRVVVALTEIIGPAANSLFDVPTPAEARADFEAAINGINKEGGVGCRKLVATFVNVNPTDEAGMLARCREFAAGNYFAVVDTGSMATRPAVLACLGQNKVPYFGAYYITESLRRQFYPYLFSFYYKEQVYRDTAFALRELGFFDPAKGFKKLGFAYRDCEKDAITSFRNDLRAAGVANASVEPYNLGCPAVFASEADMAQMTQTFIARGVTHVIGANVQGDIARITAHFEQQGFRPKWGLPDEALLSIATGSRAPDRNNIANAYAITLARDAEDNTPGMTPTAGTEHCNAYRKVAGLKPVWEVPANAGNSCDQLWMFDGAFTNASRIERGPALQAGLQQTKSIDFSYPQAPNDFSGNGVTTGGQFWRVAQFNRDCNCWRIIQRDFRPGF